MIKNIFLPDKVNDYFLFAQRIVGISIQPLSIHATQLYAKGRSCVVEKHIHEPLDTDSSLGLNERIVTALKKIKPQLDAYDSLRTILPSNIVVFKEIKLPFYDHEQIKMVINFEVEPLLPFALHDTVLDFIITKQIKEEQSSEILVAATQKKYIAEHLSLFEQAGMKPTSVTVDMFALYGLYQSIPQYAQQQGSVALLGLDLHTTHMGHIHNNQLRTIRSLNKGISSIAKIASDELKMVPRDVMDYFMRFGLSDTDNLALVDTLKSATTTFLNETYFTLNALAAQTAQNEPITKLLLYGDAALITGLSAFVQKELPAPSEIFGIQPLVDSQKITFKAPLRDHNTLLLSLAAALPNTTTSEFNFLADQASPAKTGNLIKQLIAIGLISILSLGALLTYSIFQIGALETEEQENRQEAIQILRKEFPKAIDADEQNLEEALVRATEALKNEEKTWRAFSGRSQTSFLRELLELTNTIDKEALGFVIESITISQDTLRLKARVNDYEALKILERELKQSKLFAYVEPQTSPSFDMKITLAENNGESR